MKSWFLFGYKKRDSQDKSREYETGYRRWGYLAFGFWYLKSSRCPVTGVWL